jgi:CheY-like chemotaxis protein
MVLLVEDDQDDAFLVERAMRKASLPLPGYRAKNGQEALDYLTGVGEFSDRKKFPLPTLILLDLKLPFVHGLEVLRRIKEDAATREIAVVILSSSLDDTDRITAKRLGAKNFLVKPPTAEMLRDLFISLNDLN